jgi:diguanylate cyclase (GGDEF)-like protein
MQNVRMMTANDPNVDAELDNLHFADEVPDAQEVGNVFWRILIVDDEPDVHRATTFALSQLKILGRELEFLHAHSAEEAAELLRREKDIAVVLLDVVMDGADAGLQLVHTIRKTLALSDVRIILRTGQPGYAPEIETIYDYDINDYKTKSELTRTKLYASVTAALRAYSQIRALDELAFYDSLSALPNRNRFIQLVDAQLAQGAYSNVTIAILDIDDFSEVNDALGHQQGDRLLQAVAQRLSTNLSPGTTVARIGSDTFGLMGTLDAVDPVQLLGLFQTPFEVQSDSMLVTATIGLAHLTHTNESGSGALKDANIALKRAKKIQRGSYVLYSSEMGSEIRERVRLLQGLRTAVQGAHLFIAYQPQISLVDGQVVGVEALLRWRTDAGVFIAPDRFIPLAEASGLIVPIGDWVLRMSCLELGRLQALGFAQLRMSVNVSQIQFRHPEFLTRLQAALRDTGINPSCLELEITESVTMEDPLFMLETLSSIKRLGVSIAIDDFGTGYSSLSQLRLMPVDRLKIDRAFVRELDSSPAGGHIATMVIQLGRNLNMKVIAEGVEEQGQADVLKRMGCDEAQGFLFARPFVPIELTSWLEARKPIPVDAPIP